MHFFIFHAPILSTGENNTFIGWFFFGLWTAFGLCFCSRCQVLSFFFPKFSTNPVTVSLWIERNVSACLDYLLTDADWLSVFRSFLQSCRLITKTLFDLSGIFWWFRKILTVFDGFRSVWNERQLNVMRRNLAPSRLGTSQLKGFVPPLRSGSSNSVSNQSAPASGATSQPQNADIRPSPVLPAIKAPPVSESLPMGAPGSRYFNAVWCKQSTRKHKKWEGDAFLIAKPPQSRLVILKDPQVFTCCSVFYFIPRC